MNFNKPNYIGHCAKCPMRFTPDVVRRIKRMDSEATEFLLREFGEDISRYATRVIYDDRGNPVPVVNKFVALNMQNNLLEAVWGADLMAVYLICCESKKYIHQATFEIKNIYKCTYNIFMNNFVFRKANCFSSKSFYTCSKG